VIPLPFFVDLVQHSGCSRQPYLQRMPLRSDQVSSPKTIGVFWAFVSDFAPTTA
jgi:hypothetical protein